MKRMTNMTIGTLIELCYEEFLSEYGDSELAALATATVINDILSPNEVDDLRRIEDAA